MNARTLHLHQEALADLTTDELGAVAGGPQNPAQTYVCDTTLVPTCVCTGYYPSLNAPCTEPVRRLTTAIALTGICG